VPAEITPPELARLVDFAERPRVDDWSLRAALVRYAQPQPQRVSDLLEIVRRIDWVLAKQSSVIERDGDALWAALESGSEQPDPFVVAVLQAAREVDQLGDTLAAWAVDVTAEPPDTDVDRVIGELAPRLEEIGVPREEPPPRGARGRG